ncbi:MAG: PIN domain-containing protein [Candidatus Cryptobacteroides sp.]|jgi:predicted nucleic acid-binding protein
MKPRLFLDTNILVDYLTNRSGSLEAINVLQLAKEDKVDLITSVLSMANIAYILRKELAGLQFYENMRMISSWVEVAANTAFEYEAALNLEARDFEDALQYFCAETQHCAAIITKNINDFTFSVIPVMTPSELLQKDYHGQLGT